MDDIKLKENQILTVIDWVNKTVVLAECNSKKEYDEFCKKTFPKSLQYMKNNPNMYILRMYDYGLKEFIYKIGRAKNVKKRIKQYITQNPTIEEVRTFWTFPPIEFESKFHKNNKSIYGREWYTTNAFLDSKILEYADKDWTVGEFNLYKYVL